MAARKGQGHGKGSIWTDEKGRTYYQPPAINGQRPGRIRCTDPRHAEEVKAKWLADLERKKADGVDLAAGLIPLHAWLTKWLDTYRSQKAETTRRNDTTYIRKYLLLLPNVAIERLDSDTIAEWVNELLGSFSPHVARRAFALLTMALDRAVKSNRIGRNPAKGVDAPLAPEPKEKGEDAILTEAQLGCVLDVLDGEQRRLIELTAGLGFRRGEALGLLFRDFDTRRGRLTVSGQVQTYGTETKRLDTTKTRRSRTIALPAAAIAVLEAQRRAVYTRQLAAEQWTDNGLIFPGSAGEPQKPNTLYKWWERLLARLELPPATVHSLRHLAITRLDRLGVRTVVRKSIMGHAKDVHEGYSSVSDHDQRQALELAWRAMGQDEERRAAK